MKRVLISCLIFPLVVLSEDLPEGVMTEKVDGILWYFTQRQLMESSYSIVTVPGEVMVGFGISAYQVHVGAIPSDTVGEVSIPTILGGKPVTAICRGEIGRRRGGR